MYSRVKKSSGSLSTNEVFSEEPAEASQIGKGLLLQHKHTPSYVVVVCKIAWPHNILQFENKELMTSPKEWLYHPHQPPHSAQDPVQLGQNSALTPMTPNGCLISLRISYWHQHFQFPTSWKSLGFGSGLHLFWDMVLLQACHFQDVKSRHLCGLFYLLL